jgi:hypothetical protein
MKEVTLKIPDKQFGFFMELIRQLGFEVAEEVDIPEDHKNAVRERVRSAKDEELVTWKEARKQFRFKRKA